MFSFILLRTNVIQTPEIAPTPTKETFTATKGIRVTGFAKNTSEVPPAAAFLHL